MNKNKVFSTVFLSLVLIVMGLLTSCQVAGQPNVAVAAASESEHSFVGAKLTELNTDDISAYRWLAIARFYSGDPYFGVDLTTLAPDDVMAFRWLALARAYEK